MSLLNVSFIISLLLSRSYTQVTHFNVMCVCACVFLHKYDPELSSRQFGVELSRLTSEERTVPQLVEKLINYIEMHGLYTEGIYRKSGSTNKIKELRQGLDTGETKTVLHIYVFI